MVEVKACIRSIFSSTYDHKDDADRIAHRKEDVHFDKNYTLFCIHAHMVIAYCTSDSRSIDCSIIELEFHNPCFHSGHKEVSSLSIFCKARNNANFTEFYSVRDNLLCIFYYINDHTLVISAHMVFHTLNDQDWQSICTPSSFYVCRVK